MYPLKVSTAITVPFFVHDANGDGVTAIADGSFTKRISKGSGAFAAMTVTITEMENGWYSFPLSTAHSDTAGILTISFSASGAKRVNLQFRVSANIFDDLATPAQVNAEVVDAVNVDAYGEPGQGAPPVSASIVTKIGYMYKTLRNRNTQTGSLWQLFADDGTTVDQKRTVSDDLTTAEQTEIISGP